MNEERVGGKPKKIPTWHNFSNITAKLSTVKPAYTVTLLYRKPAYTVKIPWSQVILTFYEANKTLLYRNKDRLIP